MCPLTRDLGHESWAAPISAPSKISTEVLRGASPRPAELARAQAISAGCYRKLVRHHLRRLPALFTRFTGLFSQIIWSPVWPGRWTVQKLAVHSRVCRQVTGGRAIVLRQCTRCAAEQLKAAFAAGHAGHRFTCFLRVQNFWLPVIVRGCIVGLAFVQALALPAPGVHNRQQPSRPTRASSCRGSGSRLHPRGRENLTEAEFCEAARLLRLIIEHAETAAVAALRKTDLMQAQRALGELQTVATRLRGELNGLLPVFNKASPVLEPQSHAQRTAHAALEFIHQHYVRPFSLEDCATELHLNAAYLSAQFSRAVGIPFKAYLTELRIEKARELLGDPARTIAEVASAVGYASENRFRLAFKKMTGLSPRLWRETLRIQAHRTN